MNPDSVFSKDYQSKPYWWERTPRPSLEPIELPKETEVLVVGSGYTGLCTSYRPSLEPHETGWKPWCWMLGRRRMGREFEKWGTDQHQPETRI